MTQSLLVETPVSMALGKGNIQAAVPPQKLHPSNPAYPEEKVESLKKCVRTVISGLGEDLSREGLLDTPKRVAKAWLDMSAGYRQDTAGVLGGAFFTEEIVEEGGNGIVIVRDIDFASTNEETLLPFHGRCHIGYVPRNGVVLGLSKLARLTKHFGKRLQTPTKLAGAIAAGLQRHLQCDGVAILLEARQLAPTEIQTVTASCVAGCFATSSVQFEEFCALMGVPVPDSKHMLVLTQHGVAPAVPSTTPAPEPAKDSVEADMEAAVNGIIKQMGEDTARPGMQGSALRYVRGLMASTSGYKKSLPSREAALVPAAKASPEVAVTPVMEVTLPEGSFKLAQATVSFNSQCEHHMLPFYGNAMVVYIPAQGGETLLSQSAVEDIVRMFTLRLQVQERITHQLADAVNDLAMPDGVMVVCQAAHMCMLARGVENHSGATSTFAVRGVFEGSSALRQHVLRAFSAQQ